MREDGFVVKAAVANDCGAAERGKRKSHTGEVYEGDGRMCSKKVAPRGIEPLFTL